jgi:hypothetical protein
VLNVKEGTFDQQIEEEFCPRVVAGGSMMRALRQLRKPNDSNRHVHLLGLVLGVILPVVAMLGRTGAAQQTAADSLTGSAICTFDDGKQISVRYKPVAVGRAEQPPTGQVWAPGGSAMTLFTETGVAVGKTLVPAGAYTMYLLLNKKDWILIVSRNVTIDGKYDKNQDLVRANMQTGELSQAEGELKVFFGHTGPKQCETNVDYGKTRAWLDFVQK